jgi:hypothetical protein
MSRRAKSPEVPTASIKRLFEEFMKTYADEGTHEQFRPLYPEDLPDDYDEDCNYRPLDILQHLHAIACFLGGDVEDRFMECMAAPETVMFRPEAWRPDEDEEAYEAKQAAKRAAAE